MGGVSLESNQTVTADLLPVGYGASLAPQGSDLDYRGQNPAGCQLPHEPSGASSRT